MIHFYTSSIVQQLSHVFVYEGYQKVLQHTHTHTRLMALFRDYSCELVPEKVKPIWILLKQETVSSSGISWAICKSASRSRKMTIPVPHHSSFFRGWMPFLPPNQQRQSAEGKKVLQLSHKKLTHYIHRVTVTNFDASWLSPPSCG